MKNIESIEWNIFSIQVNNVLSIDWPRILLSLFSIEWILQIFCALKPIMTSNLCSIDSNKSVFCDLFPQLCQSVHNYFKINSKIICFPKELKENDGINGQKVETKSLFSDLIRVLFWLQIQSIGLRQLVRKQFQQRNDQNVTIISLRSALFGSE